MEPIHVWRAQAVFNAPAHGAAPAGQLQSCPVCARAWARAWAAFYAEVPPPPAPEGAEALFACFIGKKNSIGSDIIPNPGPDVRICAHFT
eukprot:COSAG02_NODE_49828_length_324_cov_0.915556_1_plen_89_part_10